jgi:ATP-dependent DNA helicase RecQ
VNASPTGSSDDLRALLRQFFGFASFRPLQEEIIGDALAGRDVFALLPTGGGKSLCFQLPALIRPGLTVVVSPLIALMKDQVDALRVSGINATYLNSSVSPGDQHARLQGLRQGEFRLLYVAPERLLMPGTLSALCGCKVTLLAIDEAHCISEWGHDFRPEYRQLANLRTAFPETPMIALTATATQRVRGDIVQQLQLRDPRCYVASFNRPNLTYRVVSKSEPLEQVMEYLRARPNDSGIIYCQARRTADSLARDLVKAKVPARPYHAGLSAAERTRHQELFLRDEIRVVCATIAFGMGINKPNVRYVLHYDVPKNVEGYYQETGRAGRDGLPSECLLLFSAGDIAKYSRFIKEKPEAEQIVAREQLRRIAAYAESTECRRRTLLGYFGEHIDGQNCGNCDNCLAPRDTYDGTIPAQKMLSCVYRVRERSGFDFGVNHIIQVLVGADTEAIRKWDHKTLSTYAVGAELGRAEWFHIARELVRLGHLEEVQRDRFAVIHLTADGLAALKQRKPIELTRPAKLPGRDQARAVWDEALYARLISLRKRLADERVLPPHVVLPDIALQEMARRYPRSERELSGFTGMSERKLRDFAAPFLREISDYLRQNPRQVSTGNRAARKTRLTDDTQPYDEVLFGKLREARRRIADERGVPAFVILHDSALREIARHPPASIEALATIRNVGRRRASNFGEAVLAVIRAQSRS